MSAPGPNVVVVVLDAARRDALEPYGAPVGSSPAIAQLARRGAALPDVHATGPWTVPSHASMFTGLLPRAAGLAQAATPVAPRAVVESHRDRLLAEVLRRGGYRTRGVSANLWLGETSGFALGFDEFVSPDSDRHAQLARGRGAGARLRWVRDAALARADDGGGSAEATMARWIEGAAGEPFFWFVNLLECHSPYLPPRPYGEVSLLDRVRAAEEARRYYTLDAIWRVCAGEWAVSDRTLDRMRRLYAGAIRYLDDWVGRLLERLDAAGLLDDTLVVVASDHGENFGEGGLIAHTHSLDERLIGVPFVAAGPGAGGRAIRSLAELPRFIADAVGLAEHPWGDGQLPEGAAVAQFDPPTEADDPRLVAAAAEWGWSEEQVARFATPLTCAVADGLKLLRRGDAEELYDLRADPLERAPAPIATADPDALAVLRRALEHPSAAARGPGEPPATTAPTASAEELAAIEQQMKLLGYM